MRNFITVRVTDVVKIRTYQHILLGTLINSLCHFFNDICSQISFAILDLCMHLMDIESNELFYTEQQAAANASVCPQVQLSSVFH